MANPTDHDAANLEELLDQLDTTTDTDDGHIKLEKVVAAVGKRSFAPLLLLVGTLITSPLSGMPGLPSTVALIVLLTSVQMLVGRKHFWLPAWLLNRQISRERMTKTVSWLRPPARFVDKLIKPRLSFLVDGPGRIVIALTCAVLALGMPMLELIPFSASIAGVALAAFGLALVASDGLLAIIAYIAVGAAAWLLTWGLFL